MVFVIFEEGMHRIGFSFDRIEEREGKLEEGVSRNR